ncbi:hypothetical protein TNCV_4480241, partial [Trichonephila clavipes]
VSMGKYFQHHSLTSKIGGLNPMPASYLVENECADSLAKEARDQGKPCTVITFGDGNTLARSRLSPYSFKKPLITDFNSTRITASIIARLRTHHQKGMEIHSYETRPYIQCKRCPEI